MRRNKLSNYKLTKLKIMKSMNYEAPVIEVAEVELEGAILTISDVTVGPTV